MRAFAPIVEERGAWSNLAALCQSSAGSRGRALCFVEAVGPTASRTWLCARSLQVHAAPKQRSFPSVCIGRGKSSGRGTTALANTRTRACSQRASKHLPAGWDCFLCIRMANLPPSSAFVRKQANSLFCRRGSFHFRMQYFPPTTSLPFCSIQSCSLLGSQNRILPPSCFLIPKSQIQRHVATQRTPKLIPQRGLPKNKLSAKQATS